MDEYPDKYRIFRYDGERLLTFLNQAWEQDRVPNTPTWP